MISKTLRPGDFVNERLLFGIPSQILITPDQETNARGGAGDSSAFAGTEFADGKKSSADGHPHGSSSVGLRKKKSRKQKSHMTPEQML